MTRFTLDDRVRLSITLALTARLDDAPLHRRQDEEARRLGLCGAEIDAARHGRSFDAQIAAALALASGDEPQRRAARERASRLGIDAAVIAAIELFASGFTSD